MTEKKFPEGFFWGTATAAFQIEGALREDGRSESIWDRFCATPGKILTGETGEPACESYRRYPTDIEMMRELGVNAYRLSVAWPRVIPEGIGAGNPAGLDYYDRLIDALLEAGITPFVTLYHWDLPQVLEDRGGWTNREIVNAFARYVEVVVTRLGDRVKKWTTHNEPWCVAFLGYLYGEHAPGRKDLKSALQAAHHVLLSHGVAIPVIRERSPGAEVNIVLNLVPSYPETDSEADRKAAGRFDQTFNRWFLDPLSGRGYPAGAWKEYGDAVPTVLPEDFAAIKVPLDSLGINYYTRQVSHDPSKAKNGKPLNLRDKEDVTGRDWEIFPQGLYDLLIRLKNDYPHTTLYVTENGASYPDTPSPDGRVHDPKRTDYLYQHLNVIHRAIQEGVPVKGYFCWTLMDNFEWDFGTSSRFGLVYTDFKTQSRSLKDSGRWFGRVTRSNALVER